ncbi:MAG: hypothetical protein Q8O66_02030 [bacterium]|nr:hypothetical protein [bacterium]
MVGKQTQEEKILLIPSHEVMNGFCYAYTKALLEKLIEMKAQGRVFSTINLGWLTDIASAVCNQLIDQISFEEDDFFDNPSAVKRLIDTTKEFLAIFEV